MLAKEELRKQLRDERRRFFGTIAEATRGLLFRHPPTPVLEAIADDAVIGLYCATQFEAPTANYAQFFHEGGHRIALPRFEARSAAMEFASFSDPLGNSDLERGPFGISQPGTAAETLVPTVLFVPLLGFTAQGDRIGQGAGHYDRWLADHPDTQTIGLAWDCQLVEALPAEPHDQQLDMIVTPTRLFEAT